MADLLAPGADRDGGLTDDAHLLAAMVRVEAAWLAALVGAGMAPADAADPLVDLVSADHAAGLAGDAESAGNPVVPLVALLRDRLAQRAPLAARWVHRGLTSQDVLDTALVLVAGAVLDRVLADVRGQVALLVDLAERHRGTVMVARTLTQHAVPTTFGLKAATWLGGVLDAAEDLARVRTGLAVQAGGAAGTRAATVELARVAGRPDAAAGSVVAGFAAGLGLLAVRPWHTRRRPVTALGDALVTATDAWGHLANDVLLLTRPEVGELSLSGTLGGSSTMPHKQNPVLPLLVHRAALAAPLRAAELHLASAETVDERPDGAWHLEWDALRSLLSSTAVAASQTTAVLGALVVHPEVMRDRAEAATPDLLAERDAIRDALDAEPAAGGLENYLGAGDQLITETCQRAATVLEGLP